MKTLKRNIYDMDMLPIFFIYTCFCVYITILVQAQGQSGFISIDCGILGNSSYTDEITGLVYQSDSSFINNTTGISSDISIQHLSNSVEQQFRTVRCFPEGNKNCYTLRPADGKGTKYLIRARFLYGNYDNNNSVPQFDLYIGANKWGSVKLENVSSVTTMEIIHIPLSDIVFVCLVNSGHGTPFISALELRPLRNSTYVDTRAAVLFQRLDIGSQAKTPVRYKDDLYDRIWKPFNFPNRPVLKTNLTIDSQNKNAYQPPSVVMSTAMAPENASDPLFTFELKPESPDFEYYIYMHFAELQKLEPNQYREFYIFENAKVWFTQPSSPDYLYTTTEVSPWPAKSNDTIQFSLFQTKTSTLQPILNALEVYIVRNFSEPNTDDLDVDVMMKIKSEYDVIKNWQGDPCSPKTSMWDGLNCSFNGQDPVRVISLNLSSSGLTGGINPHISDLTMIQYLYLSNNSLAGPLPSFLSKLQYLKVLDLSGNKLTGSVPVELIQKSNSGTLLLSVSGNPGLCASLFCKKQKKRRYIVPVIASVASVFVLLVAIAVGFKLTKRRKRGNALHSVAGIKSEIIDPKRHQFTHADIVRITNNFEKVIGKGGFGTVYHGNVNESQVAVKILSESSEQGDREFRAEVTLLMRIHHRNLLSLVGYCIEKIPGKKEKFMGLIYEYMANGNLGQLLSAKSLQTLSWKERLQMAVESAHGLAYLHHGCTPPIVHRDIKPANILLNEKLQAKIADFGLSRAFPVEGATQRATNVAGTIGYLDPEYFETNQLNEKSDVFSFGVVLMEMITGQPICVKISDDESWHINKWVARCTENGDVRDVVDPRLGEDFCVDSARKAVEIATTCVHPTSRQRPTMNQVVIDLNECLAIELGSKEYKNNEGNHSVEDVNLRLDYSDINPLPR